MNIISPNSLFPTLTVSQPVAELRNWQPGQQLQALVSQLLGNGLVELKVGRLVLTAQIDSEVSLGQQLLLEVVKAGEKPLLRAANQDAIARLVESALRAVLPRQQDHQFLLNDIRQLIRSQLVNRLPQPVQQAFNRLFQAFPDKAVVTTPEGIRDAIRNSGIFLESRLSSQQRADHVTLSSDFKAGILRLREALVQALANEVGKEVRQPGRPADNQAAQHTYSRPVITAQPLVASTLKQ